MEIVKEIEQKLKEKKDEMEIALSKLKETNPEIYECFNRSLNLMCFMVDMLNVKVDVMGEVLHHVHGKCCSSEAEEEHPIH